MLLLLLVLVLQLVLLALVPVLQAAARTFSSSTTLRDSTCGTGRAQPDGKTDRGHHSRSLAAAALSAAGGSIVKLAAGCTIFGEGKQDDLHVESDTAAQHSSVDKVEECTSAAGGQVSCSL